MNESVLARYEAALHKLQAELQEEMNSNKRESAPVKLDGVMGRISRMDAMQAQQVALAVRRQREQRLTRISTALQRIRDGEYGRCCRCEGTIRQERLDVFPDAVLCVRCGDRGKG